jgi:uncharacterized protein (TIGR02118 family)
MVKMSILYGHPQDPAAFEKYYAETHLPLAGKMQGVRKLELAKVVATPGGGAPAYYRLADLYFDDAEQMKQAMGMPEAKAAVADLSNFATGGVTVLISELA